jgi:SAM-dependent methyltransferase
VRPAGQQEVTGYDAAYYSTHLGERYAWDNPAWTIQFGRVADAIVGALKPRTVLDVGCGFGFLVGALVERGVDAEGFDASEYAIAQVPPELAGRCRAASIDDPGELRPVDLVTCIEVVEHLPPGSAERAVDTLVAAAPVVLFSSSPTDFAEPTHQNVQPTSYWAGLFARRGFFRDPGFDATVVAPHAVLFRKLDEPDAVALADAYERALDARPLPAPPGAPPRRRLRLRGR